MIVFGLVIGADSEGVRIIEEFEFPGIIVVVDVGAGIVVARKIFWFGGGMMIEV